MIETDIPEVIDVLTFKQMADEVGVSFSTIRRDVFFLNALFLIDYEERTGYLERKDYLLLIEFRQLLNSIPGRYSRKAAAVALVSKYSSDINKRKAKQKQNQTKK